MFRSPDAASKANISHSFSISGIVALLTVPLTSPLMAQSYTPITGQVYYYSPNTGTNHSNLASACMAEFYKLNSMYYPAGRWEFTAIQGDASPDNFKCLMRAPNPWAYPIEQRWLYANGGVYRYCKPGYFTDQPASSGWCKAVSRPRPEANQCKCQNGSASTPCPLEVGNPIDVGSGRKSYSVSDYLSGSTGISIQRKYSFHTELSPIDFEFGIGWQGLIPARGTIGILATEPLRIVLQGGLELTFTYSTTTGQWTFSSPYPDQLRAKATALFPVPTSANWRSFFETTAASWQIDFADGERLFVQSVPTTVGSLKRVVPTQHIEASGFARSFNYTGQSGLFGPVPTTISGSDGR